MIKERRFSTSIFGFNKRKVSEYLEDLLEDFQRQLQEKANEVLSIRRQNLELLNKADHLSDVEKNLSRIEATIAQKETEVRILREEKNEMQQRLAQKDAEINALRSRPAEDHEKVAAQVAKLEAERAKVVNVLIRAEEIAQQIISDAHRQAAATRPYNYVNSYSSPPWQSEHDSRYRQNNYEIHQRETDVLQGEAKFQRYKNELMAFSQGLSDSVARFNEQISKLSHEEDVLSRSNYIKNTMDAPIPGNISEPTENRPGNVRLL
jgi:cell division septum initiation protein DivIVA